MKEKKGFTLVELLAVIVIIGVICIMIFSKMSNTISRNKIKLYKEQEHRLEQAALKYLNDNYLSQNLNDIKLTLNELIEKGYITEIKDLANENNVCEGYVLINNLLTLPISKAYIDCSEYTTEDYNNGQSINTIILDANGGKVEELQGWISSENEIYATKTITSNTVYGTLPEATKEGYIFAGWFTEVVGGTQIIETDIVDSNKTLYAHFSTNINTITLNSNSGIIGSAYNWISNNTNTVSTKQIPNGNQYLVLPEASKVGYIFAGWFTAASGGTQIIETDIVNSNITLYAQYTLNTNLITLNSNGGTIDVLQGWSLNNTSTISTKNIPSGSKYGTLPEATKEGHMFTGWFTAASGGTQIHSTSTVNANNTLYAHWGIHNFGDYLLLNKLGTSGLSSNKVAGMYRYQGTNSTVTNNYICFGTSDKTTCLSNTDAYLYRIIGITETGIVKLIKKECLNQAMQYNGNGVNYYPGSTVYLNITKSYYLTNTTYMPNEWLPKVKSVTWKYGNTPHYSTKTISLANIYNRENNWDSSINSKVGIMHLSDYLSAATPITCTISDVIHTDCVTKENRSNSWVSYQNNDTPTGATEERELLLNRNNGYDYNGTTKYPGMDYGADGGLGFHWGMKLYVRPVINLLETVTYTSGTGTITDPYIIT